MSMKIRFDYWVVGIVFSPFIGHVKLTKIDEKLPPLEHEGPILIFHISLGQTFFAHVSDENVFLFFFSFF